ncbi:diguanylate cyclase [Reinekea sp.]|jgi:diguanylate cyclase (GGDEF)-like protein|uniref:sensor domain-containing diguanylate cyclase n=1 Tax=Reinekea sp. TaxID=1970455 RepID=UPI003988FBB0
MPPLLQIQLIALMFSILCAFSASADTSGKLRFEVDEGLLASGQRVYLNADWYFVFGEQIPTNQLRQRIERNQMDSLSVPGSWNKKVKNLTDDPFQHGVATFALPLSFSKPPNYALTIHAQYIASSYRLYWLPEGDQEPVIIGTSGDWETGLYNGSKIDYFHFPNGSAGILIAHVAKKNVNLGGFQEPIYLQRSEPFTQANNQDLVVRSILVGSMLIMCIHYLIQYFYSRASISTLLLSLLCLSAVLRSLSTAGFIELFLHEWVSSYYAIRIKLEYTSMLIIPTAYFVYLNSMLPKIVPKFIVKIASVSFFIGLVVTLVISTPLMTKYLQIYQLFLFVWAMAILVLIGYGVYRRRRFSRQIMVSTLIVCIGGFNDVFASYSGVYNFYVVEYVFFAFLFFQAQLVGQQLRDSQVKSIRLTEEKQELQLAHSKAIMASHQDHLTGLCNRLALAEEIEQLTRVAAAKADYTVGVILFDLDHFKQVNDTNGHDIGDEILIFVASLLHGHSLRASDFKCRYGGEEFLILLPGAGLEKAQEVAQEIRIKLEGAVAYSDEKITLKITASFGVSVYYVNRGESLKEVISQADSALYRAKQSGRNCVSVVNLN